jgi:hypothetical protein
MTTQTTAEKKEALSAQIKNLLNNLKNENARANLDTIKQLQKEIKSIERDELLSNVNAKQDRLRAAALQVWEAERPTEDITTNDGSLHKVKAKKYPKLAALNYVRLKFEGSQYVEATYNGERFRMVKSHYEYNKPTQYIDFADFNEFLNYNSIATAPITRAEFDKVCSELEEANKKLENAIEAYKLEREKLNISSLQYWGLMGQSALHEYKYTANK